MRRVPDALSMQDAKAILDALDARSIGREAVAKVLGISQPNATRLFKPDPRTKKKRVLTYDEGRKLIAAFNLDETSPNASLNDEVVARLLEALVPLVPRSGLTGASATRLAKALVYGLELLGEASPTRPNHDAIEVAARGAASRFRDLTLQ
jgi:hypothetical protein